MSVSRSFDIGRWLFWVARLEHTVPLLQEISNFFNFSLSVDCTDPLLPCLAFIFLSIYMTSNKNRTVQFCHNHLAKCSSLVSVLVKTHNSQLVCYGVPRAPASTSPTRTYVPGLAPMLSHKPHRHICYVHVHGISVQRHKIFKGPRENICAVVDAKLYEERSRRPIVDVSWAN
ncbi:unnamed protein product, partial [Ixodes persulcatus]